MRIRQAEWEEYDSRLYKEYLRNNKKMKKKFYFLMLLGIFTGNA